MASSSGRVDPDGFNLAASAANVQRNYVQANHKMYGPSWDRCCPSSAGPNVSYEKAAQIVDGQNVQVVQQLIAYVDIIGYRDERGVLQRLPHAVPGGEVVTRAENDIIQSVLGLKPEGRSTAT